MPDITLPAMVTGGPKVQWKAGRSVVVVGANGSGKSRFGAWIEENAGANAHRIGAQRALKIPPVITPRPYEQARSTVLYGTWQDRWSSDLHEQQRTAQRWRNEPTSFLLDDFEAMLAMLFAEEGKRNREYTRAALTAPPPGPAPKCNLDRLQEIWSAVLPHRQLVIGDDKIQARVPEASAYEGRHMSDGERVAIYLVGQVLIAPLNAIIIVDEPEIHIHEAIQSVLWDALEAARPDSTFVYITHDLGFAASRSSARKIWVKQYDGTNWQWEEVASTPGLPDALLLEILGSRRSVLFVEGDETSYDTSLYAALHQGNLVLPRQTADKVIEATKAMLALPSLHHLKPHGVVDRDRRGDEEVAALREAGISVIGVAEVENLMCIREAIRAVAVQLKYPDAPGACQAAEDKVLEHLARDAEQQAMARALAEVQFRLNGFGPKIGKGDAAKLEQELQDYLKGIDLKAAVAKARNLFDGILRSRDYPATLRYYNSKGIPAHVAQTFGVSKDLYCQLVLGLVKGQPDGAVAKAMRDLIE